MPLMRIAVVCTGLVHQLSGPAFVNMKISLWFALTVTVYRDLLPYGLVPLVCETITCSSFDCFFPLHYIGRC